MGKTRKKSTTYIRLFNKYTTNNRSHKNHATKQQIKKLMSMEFNIRYNTHIMNSFMAIWSTTIQGRQVITRDTFVNKLFKKPDGFFRDIHL